MLVMDHNYEGQVIYFILIHTNMFITLYIFIIFIVICIILEYISFDLT